MLKKYVWAAMTVSALGLSGCVGNANIGAMTYTPQTFTTPKRLSLLNNIEVKSVSGGQEAASLGASKISSSNFKAALVQSLQRTHLYQTSSKPQYALTAIVMNVAQPVVGRNTVKFKVHYRLQDVKKHIYLYDNDVTSSYTAKMSASVEGLRKVNEGSARENIKQFINDLFRLPRVM